MEGRGLCLCMYVDVFAAVAELKKGMGLVTDQPGFCSDGCTEPSTGQMLNRESQVDASAGK